MDTLTFAVTGLDHGHIFGMTDALLEAGARLAGVYDRGTAAAEAFAARYGCPCYASEEALLADPAVRLVASAIVTAQRADLGCRVMASGKDYFVDKAPMTTLAQLEQVKAAVLATGRRYFVYFSERLCSESAVFAEKLIAQGTIGRVVQVMGLGPHRLNPDTRPAWFFEKAQYGGILCDIGSHQIEQFLFFTGAQDATIAASHVGNVCHPDYPELEDYGDCTLVADNGATGYFRIDWLTPDGLSNWGDGRTLILGTLGYIELRKFVDLAQGPGEQVYWADREGEHHRSVAGTQGLPFFRRMIADCLHGTDTAMPQDHIFKAAELCLKAEALAQTLHYLPKE